MKTIILVITSTTTALMAGLFFSWSVSVTNGLAKLSNLEYIRAFQSMNRAIQNRLNNIRTVASTLSIVFVIMACIVPGDN